MANIVLGVSGSIAAYRAADLARDFMRMGHTVRVCLTDSAQRFVSPALFEALTGQPCLQDVFEEPNRGRMAHIDWARAADLVVVAPATANTIAKIAHGVGDDMLTTLVLATTAPLVVAPAMNPQMYANAAHQEALTILKRRAAWLVEPAEGDVACGEHGQGKLASNAEISTACAEVLRSMKLLSGKRVLITSGPTQEPIDVVRYITNRSSGKMGAALARAALLMGADVTVIAGPQSEPLPLLADVRRVRTALEMADVGRQLAADQDVIVAAAAVADFRPAQASETKIRRTRQALTLQLEPNPDVVALLVAVAPQARTVGFAAEPDASIEVCKQKIIQKGLFAIAANDITRPDAGFESETNELTLVFSDDAIVSSGLRSKLGCSLWLFEQIVLHKALD